MKFSACLLLCFLLLIASQSSSQRLMENLDRGVVAVRMPDGKVFVSWRLLGTEPGDLSFNLYRKTGTGKPEKLNKQPIAKVTHFVDAMTDTLSERKLFR
jgi:rhamnogalacturonan endolyase